MRTSSCADSARCARILSDTTPVRSGIDLATAHRIILRGGAGAAACLGEEKSYVNTHDIAHHRWFCQWQPVFAAGHEPPCAESPVCRHCQTAATRRHVAKIRAYAAAKERSAC